MLSGRILIVSDRKDVIAELEPILRAGEHLALSVSSGNEALRALNEGLVPDLVISDLGSDHVLDGIEYVWRFRELNRVGRHMVVVEDGAPFSGVFGDGTNSPSQQITPLPRPFDSGEVQRRIQEAVERIDRELVSMRGEMYRELDRLQQTIRDVQRETVSALALTISARDPYMAGHSTRVAELSCQVAREMGVASDAISRLETAAVLHEIGKSGVPIELLHKTEPLSTEELARIRNHARIGAEIARGVPSLTAIAPLIEHQGADYVELGDYFGRTSEDFLLVAILRVVDVYDAMTSERAYRVAMPRSYWEAELRKGAGKAFHPEVVEAFFRVTTTPSLHSPSQTSLSCCGV